MPACSSGSGGRNGDFTDKLATEEPDQQALGSSEGSDSECRDRLKTSEANPHLLDSCVCICTCTNENTHTH